MNGPHPSARPHITPLPSPLAHAGTIILFGGTFDPPHRAHVELPREARERVAPDAWLLYVPAARSPFKHAGPTAPDADRVEMLRLALRDVPRAAVWTDEIDRAQAGEPSFTVHTLQRLRAAVGPGPTFRLLIGADQAAALHAWREPRRVVEMAEPIVMMRGGRDSPDALIARLRGAGYWNDDELAAWASRIVPIGRSEISATGVRRLLADDAPEGELAAALDPRVLDYIRSRGLYRRG